MIDIGDVRRAQDRDLGNEGIAMIVALVDERPSAPVVADRAGDDAAALAAKLDEARASLAPTRRDGDLGVVMTLLATVAHADHGTAS